MSQKAQQNPDPKHTPMPEQTQKEAPIIGLSPDDDIVVKPVEGTGQTGRPHK